MGAEFENLGVPSDAERPSPTATAEFARIRTVDVGLKIEFKLRADSATYPRNCSRLQFTGGWFTRLSLLRNPSRLKGSHDRGGNPYAGTYIIESASRLQVSDTRHSQRATLLDFRAEIRFSLSLRLRSSLFLVCVRFLARGVFFGARPSVPSVDSRSIVRRQDTIEWTT